MGSPFCDRVRFWVLSTFSAQETKNLSEAIDRAIQALELMVQGKTDEAMNRFNS